VSASGCANNYRSISLLVILISLFPSSFKYCEVGMQLSEATAPVFLISLVKMRCAVIEAPIPVNVCYEEEPCSLAHQLVR
jgi:hypothetical protein